jgi:single-strand DNA-binding protein
MALNLVQLHGRLTKDPDTRITSTTTVTKFTLAVDDSFSRDNTNFISCVAFGKTAETIDSYWTKGKEMVLSGRIQTGSYTKDDGTRVYTTDVIVNSVDFCGSANDSGNGNSRQTRPNNNTSNNRKAVNTQPQFEEVDDDEELPF